MRSLQELHDIRSLHNPVIQSQNLPPPPKKYGGQNVQNRGQLRTTSNFDGEYLRNGTKFWGPLPPFLKFARAKTVQNSARFRTTSEFDREYLQKASRYRQAENGVINYTISEIQHWLQIERISLNNFEA